MKVGEYLQGKMVFLLLDGVGLILLLCFLLICGVTPAFTVVLYGGIFLFTALYLAVDYLVLKRRLVQLENLLASLPERYLAGEVLPVPAGGVERCYYRVMKSVSASAIDAAETARREKEEYMEYVERWIHELKTPLTTISGYAQLMEENGLGDEELFYNGMEHILQESTRLHRMVVQLLEMQDKDRYVRMESLNITDTLRNVVDSMQMKARRYENALVLDGDGVPHTVRGREDRIRQVLINLIDNAIKYGKPGKEIWIRITEHKEMVQIAVANQGKGMSPEELKHIFEPFYRADKERSREMGSSGLGLAISKKIMEDHGGSIQVKSEPDGYTVFMVSFPEPGAHAGKADRFAASRE